MTNETRNLPTRPGWWYGTIDDPKGDGRMVALDVDSDHAGDSLRVYLRGDDGWTYSIAADSPRIWYCCPIPGPAVLAALAEYGDALAEWRADMTPERYMKQEDLSLALKNAIRAERDGAA